MSDNDFHSLKDRVLVIEQVMQTTNKTLEDVKMAIVQQSEILKNFVEVKNLQQHLDSEVKALKDNKSDTSEGINKINNFISWVKGGFVIGLVLFGILQTTYGFILKEAYSSQKELQKEIVILKIQQEKLLK